MIFKKKENVTFSTEMDSKALLHKIVDLDGEGMYDVLQNFPKQIEEALQLGKDIKIWDVTSVVVCGMGGSALPGDLLKSYIGDEIPVEVIRDYSIPKHYKKGALIFVISYSGNTEEAISCMKDGLKRNLDIISITSGGVLEKTGTKRKIIVPKGIQPRQAIAYMLLPMINVLVNAGVMKKPLELDRLAPMISQHHAAAVEQAIKLSGKLIGKTPVIYASNANFVLAKDWKIGFNENAKIKSYWNVIPEMQHNEIVGYTEKDEDTFVILLTDEEDHPQIKKRFQVLKKLLSEKSPYIEMRLTGEKKLGKYFLSIYLANLTSFFLAIREDKNPTPVKVVEELKKMLH